MAKRAKRTTNAAEPRAPTVDFAAGWIFWLVVFALLYAPSWFWASRNAYSDQQQSALFPWVLAFVMAALGAGIVSWLTNSALQWWSRRVNRVARKKR